MPCLRVELVDGEGGVYYEVTTPDVLLDGAVIAFIRDAIHRRLGARTLPPDPLRWAMV